MNAQVKFFWGMPQKNLKLLLPAYQNRHFMNVYLAKFMTYYEIHRMHREGHSVDLELFSFLWIKHSSIIFIFTPI